MAAVIAAAMPLGLFTGATAASAAPVKPQPALGFGLKLVPHTLVGPGFNIRNAGAQDKCIGINTKTFVAGDWFCTANNDQTWFWGDLAKAPDGTIWGQLVNANDQCLGLAGGSDAVGTQVVATKCDDTHPDQFWFRVPAFSVSGGHIIRNLEAFFDDSTPSQLFGVAGGSTNNGANIVLWFADGSANQSWLDVSATPSPT